MPADAVLSTMAMVIVLLVGGLTAPVVIPLFGFIGYLLMLCALWCTASILLRGALR